MGKSFLLLVEVNEYGFGYVEVFLDLRGHAQDCLLKVRPKAPMPTPPPPPPPAELFTLKPQLPIEPYRAETWTIKTLNPETEP